MPRPKCVRRVGLSGCAAAFRPEGIAPSGEIVLAVEELEAIRLADREGLYHDAASERMQVSRQTFGRILASARAKVATALVDGLALRVAAGGPEVTRPPEGAVQSGLCPRCHRESCGACARRRCGWAGRPAPEGTHE